MSVTTPAAQVLRFDTFELNLRAGELRKRGKRLRLQGQPLQVLAILLQSAGELVTREELQSQIWPADTFVDFNHSLHNAIGRIREALGDSAETPRYIETLPRRGYRFIAAVEEVASPKPAGIVRERNEAMAPVVTRSKRREGIALALCACLVVALSTWVAWRHFYAKPAVPLIRSIAVLPMGNFSGDADQEYFADGMTEELITELARIPALKVISRTSVMSYKGTQKRLPQIARELGVDGIVEGSVSREGGQVRVTVQLLDGPNDRHVWSENYQRELGGILTLQREMAEAIAQQIRVQVTPQPPTQRKAAHTVNPEAYEAYLKGRFYLSTRFSKPRELRVAKRYFEEAVQKDPNFALGYVGLADCYVYLASYRELSPAGAYKAAKAALHIALELDDSIGEAHDTLALLSWQYDRDKAATEREFKYAVSLAPNYACAHADHSTYLSWIGNRSEALAEITKSRELDPGYSFAVTESGAHYQLRDYPRLVEVSRRGVVSDPNEWLEHYFLGVGYEGTGKSQEAIREYQKAIEMSDGDQDATAALAHVYATTGKRSEAERILRELEAKSETRYVSPYMLATIHAGLGNKDKALGFLEKAHQEKSWDLVWELKSDLRLDSLRSEPRFQALVRQIS